MSRLISSSSRKTVALAAQPLASGGEGAVFSTNLSGKVAKVYHDTKNMPLEKLQVMMANPPRDPMRKRNHVAIAWPEECLEDTQGCPVGFLMPEVQKSLTLYEVSVPKTRLLKAKGFTWLYAHTAALNISLIMHYLHQSGYVIGDMKTSNILVSARALVSMIDVDSFQVIDPKSGRLFPCMVGSEGFTPAELLQAGDLSKVKRKTEHDAYGLGVSIFNLLYGTHPSAGKWKGQGIPQTLNECILNGHWVFGGNQSLVQPNPFTLPSNAVHPSLACLFERCFGRGHQSPDKRPTPAEWCKALKLAMSDLAVCASHSGHVYPRSYGKCCWCEMQKRIGVDFFPSVPGQDTKGLLQGIGRNNGPTGSKSHARAVVKPTITGKPRRQGQRNKQYDPFMCPGCGKRATAESEEAWYCGKCEAYVHLN